MLTVVDDKANNQSSLLLGIFLEQILIRQERGLLYLRMLCGHL